MSSPITASSLPDSTCLNERDMCDLEMLLMGAFSPLKGYMSKDDYFNCLHSMKLSTGEIWPMPIVLPVKKSACKTTDAGATNGAAAGGGEKSMKLTDRIGTIVATLKVTEVYEPDLEMEMNKVLGSTDPNHPHAKYLMETHKDCVYVSGSVTASPTGVPRFDFLEYRLPAGKVKEFIKTKGWESVIGFQTRNPMHRSHFELTKQALAEVREATGKEPHLLLTPAVGPTQPGDIEYHIRVRCYKKILKQYGENSVKMILLPLAMRMAGPREAVWHAIIRRNYGCTHFIVGRDHAGPSSKKQDGSPFYGPYEAHELLKSVEGELGIKPVFGTEMVYVGGENGYIQRAHLKEGQEAKTISGTEFRELLLTRKPVPEWFSFPEVVQELHKSFVPFHDLGLVVYFTGLPSAGKSTISNALYAAMLENEKETRKVTILDGDIIRLHLSKGLGFSKEDRSMNVRRIGYVASEIAKHGGICLVANIAPYEEDRKANREIITRDGGIYVEAYVSTPVEVCEERDAKGLYALAKKGTIQSFTGVSDPYEVPKNPEITLAAGSTVTQSLKEVMDYLRSKQYVV